MYWYRQLEKHTVRWWNSNVLIKEGSKQGKEERRLWTELEATMGVRPKGSCFGVMAMLHQRIAIACCLRSCISTSENWSRRVKRIFLTSSCCWSRTDDSESAEIPDSIIRNVRANNVPKQLWSHLQLNASRYVTLEQLVESIGSCLNIIGNKWSMKRQMQVATM